MSHWNYRVIEFVSPEGETWRAIHEVHYCDGVSPTSYSIDAATVIEDEGAREGMSWVLDRIREALDKPVLTKRDFPSLEFCDE